MSKYSGSGPYSPTVLKVPIAPNYKGVVYSIQVDLIHTILKYGDYYVFMDR